MGDIIQMCLVQEKLGMTVQLHHLAVLALLVIRVFHSSLSLLCHVKLTTGLRGNGMETAPPVAAARSITLKMYKRVL